MPNVKHTAGVLLVSCLLLTPLAGAAEFSANDIAPDFTSIVFTRNDILLSVSPRPAGYFKGSLGATRYFAASRSDYRFHQITTAEYTGKLQSDHFHRQLGVFDEHRDLEQTRGLRISHGTCSQDSFRSLGLEYMDLELTIEVPCSSFIVDALRFDDEVWLLTTTEGSHGRYGNGTLRIFGLTGELKSKIAVGETAGPGLALDPWTGDVWGRSLGTLVVFSRYHEVKCKYQAIHDFDPEHKRPAVFVVDAVESNGTNPLAVIAYGLGEENYEKYFRLANSLPDRYEDRLLYHYFMGGRFHDPRLPKELNGMLSDAQPTRSWLRFVCMLDDARAKQLCTLNLDEWATMIADWVPPQ